MWWFLLRQLTKIIIFSTGEIRSFQLWISSVKNKIHYEIMMITFSAHQASGPRQLILVGWKLTKPLVSSQDFGTENRIFFVTKTILYSSNGWIDLFLSKRNNDSSDYTFFNKTYWENRYQTSPWNIRDHRSTNIQCLMIDSHYIEESHIINLLDYVLFWFEHEMWFQIIEIMIKQIYNNYILNHGYTVSFFNRKNITTDRMEKSLEENVNSHLLKNLDLTFYRSDL